MITGYFHPKGKTSKNDLCIILIHQLIAIYPQCGSYSWENHRIATTNISEHSRCYKSITCCCPDRWEVCELEGWQKKCRARKSQMEMRMYSYSAISSEGNISCLVHFRKENNPTRKEWGPVRFHLMFIFNPKYINMFCLFLCAFLAIMYSFMTFNCKTQQPQLLFWKAEK